MSDRPCRVVCRTLTPEWHEARKALLTGSKALERGVGLLVDEDHPYRAGKARPFKEGDADALALWFGNQKEPMVGRALARFGGLPIRPCPLLLQSTCIPNLGASLDFLARWPSSPAAQLAMRSNFAWTPWSEDAWPEPGEVFPVEVKCRSIEPGWNRSWKWRLPKKAAWQGQVQMAVLGARVTLWAVHIDHAEIHLGWQREDGEMRDAIVECARALTSK